MDQKILTILILSFSIIVLKCDTIVNSESSNGGVGVYISGYFYGDLGREVPCYWKNGECVILPIDASSNQGETNSIFATNEDVYVSGNLGWNKGCYWKNGKLKILSTGTNIISQTIECSGISVLNDDVYISGSWEDTNSIKFPCYWKNDSLIPLSNYTNKNSGYTTSIFIKGNDIYISGALTDTVGMSHPCYWKNGNVTLLISENDTTAGYAKSIFVDENDIYTLCKYGISKEFYFKNQEPFILDNIIPSSIFVIDTDIYLTGYGDSSPVYLKNNMSNPLAIDDSSTASWATNQILVTTQNIYVIGDSYHGDMVNRSCYWENNKLEILPVTSKFNYSEANSIFVIEE